MKVLCYILMRFHSTTIIYFYIDDFPDKDDLQIRQLLYRRHIWYEYVMKARGNILIIVIEFLFIIIVMIHSWYMYMRQK